MTIEDFDKVDGMGIDRGTGQVVLVISDHLDWNDIDNHIQSMERKISAYLDFLNSGQLYENIPDARKRSVRIELIHLHEPSDEANRLLSSVSLQLSKMGIEFTHESIPKEY